MTITFVITGYKYCSEESINESMYLHQMDLQYLYSAVALFNVKVHHILEGFGVGDFGITVHCIFV